jgi:hypothetical protein
MKNRKETLSQTGYAPPMSNDLPRPKELSDYLMTEIDKAKRLSPDELNALLAPYAETFGRVFKAVQEISLVCATWVDSHRKTIEAFHSLGENGFASAIQASAERFDAALTKAKHLAKLGWTFPGQLPLSDLLLLSEMDDPALADAFMLKHYEESDPMFEDMEQRLLREPRLALFRTVLPQCFRAIRCADYALTIPCFISILENIILQFNSLDRMGGDVTKTFKKSGEVARRAKHDTMCDSVFVSLETFITQLWGQYPNNPDFLKKKPNLLARHPIQHGRKEPPNEKIEILRLLNTLETVVTLHEQLPEIFSLEPPTSNQKKISLRVRSAAAK